MMPRLTRRYPRAIGLVEEAARAGERGEVVHTLLGRGSPRPDRGVGASARSSWASRPTTAARREDRRPPPPRLGPVHPQLRRPGHRRRVGAVLDGRPAQPAVAARRHRHGRASGRTWSSSCTTRCSCTRPRHLADGRGRGGPRGGRRGRAAAVRRLPGRLPARRRGRRGPGPTPAEPPRGRWLRDDSHARRSGGARREIVVLGATGATGRLLVDQAIDRGHEVVAYVRRPEALSARPGLGVVGGQLTDEPALTAAMAGADAVLCAIGPTRGEGPLRHRPDAADAAGGRGRDERRRRAAAGAAVGLRRRGHRPVGVVHRAADLPDGGARAVPGQAGGRGPARGRRPGRHDRLPDDARRTAPPARPPSCATRPRWRTSAGCRRVPRAVVATAMLDAAEDPATVGQRLIVTRPGEVR